MSKVERYHSLDSLRGIASVIVLMNHCLLGFTIFKDALFHNSSNDVFIKILTYSPLHIFWAGHESVLLFFILSGFVLAIPYIEKEENPLYNYKEYIIKRICRIYFPYVAAMFLSVVSIYLLSDFGDTRLNYHFNGAIPGSSILSYIFMLGYDIENVNGATWSLIHEMRISFIFPFLMLILLKKDWLKNVTYILIVFFIVFIFFMLLSKSIDNRSLSISFDFLARTFYYGVFFILGALLSKYRRKMQKIIISLNTKTMYLLLIIGLCLFMSEWLIPGIGNLKYHSSEEVQLLFTLLIDGLIAIGVTIIIIIAITHLKIKDMLERKFFLFLGTISYSLYLVHPFIIPIVTNVLGESVSLITVLLIAPCLSIAFSIVFNKYIEKPSIMLGKKLTSHNHTIKLRNKGTL
jgi:peptidoglycan/LPS O-acetylase OafA/YrhL